MSRVSLNSARSGGFSDRGGGNAATLSMFRAAWAAMRSTTSGVLGRSANCCLEDHANYSALASVWYTTNAIVNLDRNRRADLDDYFLLSHHWFSEGDPE